jgi:transcriptional regulator with XRE-family HTH domain
VTTLEERYEPPPTVSEHGNISAATLAASRRRELAAFLRSRRERIRPEQVGLPAGGRRRTPGLRREEVALLSGLGVTWYTWLEQGRDIKVSHQVLEAVARTLQLDGHERSHLFTLADSPLVAAREECAALGPEISQLLDKIDPFPACVINARYDVLAYNGAYTQVSGDMALLPVEERNGLWLAFANPHRRAMVVDFDESVRRMIGNYRAAMADHVGEPSWRRFIERLQAISPEFVEMWNRHDIESPENLTKRLLHPQLGLLTFTYTNLWLTQRIGVRLMVYTPLDDATQAAMSRVYEVSPPPL